MKREIKFRFWEKPGKSYLYDIDKLQTNPSVIMSKLFNEEDKLISAEQYTGLKDKNDVEIYEGDIVRKAIMAYLGNFDEEDYEKVERYATAKVIFESNIFYCGFYCEQIDGENGTCTNDFYYPSGSNFSWDELEIIGNIHQNPELLEKK